MTFSRALLCAVALAIAASAVCVATRANDGAYQTTIQKWRQDREASLKSDDGWLTVSGLFWLHEGENRFGSGPLNDIVLPAGAAPADAGAFVFHSGRTVVQVKPGVAATINGKRIESAELRPDTSDQVVLGGVALLVHASGSRYSVRMKDKGSALRKNFKGLRWFPVDESYQVTGRFVPYQPAKKAQIQNVMGDITEVTIPGYVVFSLHGQELRLDAEDADADGISFVFRDMTSGRETYGAARFLDTPPPQGGKVVLDFNMAYNPPCAYNPYTTCPLPTPENRLRVRIAAGEMAYRH
jgi:uncharacterized protein (DUF1684 family)